MEEEHMAYTSTLFFFETPKAQAQAQLVMHVYGINGKVKFIICRKQHGKTNFIVEK